VEIPVWSSLDCRAAVIAIAAMMAMLRFKIGMLPVLAVCTALGVLLVAFN